MADRQGLHLHRLARFPCLADQALRGLGRGHLVHASEQEQHRAGDLGDGHLAVGVAVAGHEAAVEHVDRRVAGQHPPAQRHACAEDPGARAQRRGRRTQRGTGKHVDHGQRLHRVVQRGLDQRGRDLHRKRRAHQHQMRDALFEARGGFQRNQRTPAVADQRACCTPAASSSAPMKSAASSTDEGASPPLRQWPGRSTASTFQPWLAR
jgi:hypothetical protein